MLTSNQHSHNFGLSNAYGIVNTWKEHFLDTHIYWGIVFRDMPADMTLPVVSNYTGLNYKGLHM